MLSHLPSYQIWILNAVLISIWHIVIWMFCVYADASFFVNSKLICKTCKWEKNGQFYTRFLKIKKWKDKLPQYTAKGGFSKKNLISASMLDKKYIEMFIGETCRGEWNHLVCCFYFVIAFIINPINYAMIFSLLVIIGNIPFIAIQRYNRIRLLKVYAKL